MAKLASEIEAIHFLQQGGLVGLPTETVYGLAAKIDDPVAVESIFKAKRRPFFDPLIVHVYNLDQAKSLCSGWDPIADSLAKHFWPGPLTLVMPKNSLVSEVITSGLPTVGIRMPNNSVALRIIKQVGIPLAAPSANQFGKTSPTLATHVLSEFPDDMVYVVDGGACEVGIESTIVSIDVGASSLKILRPGVISESQIAKVLVESNLNFKFVISEDRLMAPGQMKHHYMPTKPLVLVNDDLTVEKIILETQQLIKSLPDQEESVKLVKPDKLTSGIEVSLSSQPSLAARQLYSRLRECSESNADFLYFRLRSYHSDSDWFGLMDRLKKAASGII